MKNKTTLYIIQGFISSGKSTFSKNLEKITGAVLINPDKWVTKIYNKDEYISDWNKCFEETVIKLWAKAKDHLNNGEDVIFDMGFWLKKDREYAKQIASECNSTFKHYYPYVPDEIIKKRILTNRPPHWAKIYLENFNKNKSLFELPTDDEKTIIINNY